MNKFFLITGYTAGATGSHLSYNQVLQSANLQLFSIPTSNISLGINRKNWIRGAQYVPYSRLNSQESYVFHNEKVYLCIGNNDKNIKNISNSSRYVPIHTSGIVQYPDGYSWLYLYKITANVQNMVNSNTIPAPSTYGLKNLVINRETDDIDCGLTAGITGTCAIYLMNSDKTSASLIHQTGLSCSICLNIAEETTKTDLLTTIFYSTGVTPDGTIQIKSTQDFLENYITGKKIDSDLNFEAQCYEIGKSSGLSAGAILSAQISLTQIEGVSSEYLLLTNSELPITIPGGTGAGASFITTPTSNKNKIIGIRLTGSGYGYVPEQLRVSLIGIIDSTKRTTIENAINLTGTSPSLTFSNLNSIFDAASINSIGTDSVIRMVNAQIDSHSPNTNFYGLLEADSFTPETIAELCPTSLKIYPYSTSGLTFGREYLNLIFNKPVSQTEILMR